MKGTVKELLLDAVTWDEPFLAHAIFYAVQQKFVSLEESADHIPFADLDHEAIVKMRDDNVLAMSKMLLFTVPMEHRVFAFYLAENVGDARSEHQRQFGAFPQKVIDVSDKMDMPLFTSDLSKYQSFRDKKQQALHFPCFVEVMQKG